MNGEGYNTFKFTTLINDDLFFWWQQIKHSISVFRNDHFNWLISLNKIDPILARAIYTYNHTHTSQSKENLDSCKKITHKDWQKLLRFTRNTFYLLKQLLNECSLDTLDNHNIKSNSITILQEYVEKHSILTIQFYVKLFYFTKKRARRIIYNLIFECLMKPPQGLLYKYYKKRFSILSMTLKFNQN